MFFFGEHTGTTEFDSERLLWLFRIIEAKLLWGTWGSLTLLDPTGCSQKFTRSKKGSMINGRRTNTSPADGTWIIHGHPGSN